MELLSLASDSYSLLTGNEDGDGGHHQAQQLGGRKLSAGDGRSGHIPYSFHNPLFNNEEIP